MASIEILDKGTAKERYKVMYDVPVLPGQKRKRKSKTFIKKSEAKQFKKKMEGELLTLSPLDANEFTFSKVTEDYLEYCSLALADNTLRGYRSIYYREEGLKNRFGNIKVKDLTSELIQRYVAHLDSLNYSAKNISNIISFLNVIMKHCIKRHYIPYNPVESVILPRKDKRKDIKAYTYAELQKLLHLAENNNMVHTVIALGALAGLRRGEIAALTWDNVDLSDNPSIKITVTKFRVTTRTSAKNSSGIKEPKTSAGIRTIPIPEMLADILRKQKVRYNTCKLQYGKNFIDSNCVVFQCKGAGYQVDSVSHAYDRFIKKYDLKAEDYGSLHQLRHTFASMLASLNTPIKDVQEMLGHSDISTTMNVYTHGFEESKRTAVTELNHLMCS